jgi:RNA polymerase sigma factor for flagellar operon FliA
VPSAADPRELLLANLSLLRDIVRFLARRYRLGADQIDELDSLVRLRMVENDYAVLRRFRQQSTLETYLNIVVQRVFHDYRNHLWGRWRPSAAAQRLGPLALALEELLYRDELTFDEACEVMLLRRQGDRATLARLYPRLPARRGRPRIEPLATAAARPSPAPDPEEAAVDRAQQQQLAAAMAAALRGLAAKDRMLLRLRFGEGLTMREIARVLAKGEKSLFKRLAGLLRTMRRQLRRSGLDAGDVMRLLEHYPALELGLRIDDADEALAAADVAGESDRGDGSRQA